MFRATILYERALCPWIDEFKDIWSVGENPPWSPLRVNRGLATILDGGTLKAMRFHVMTIEWSISKIAFSTACRSSTKSLNVELINI
jgi:hypothetical protein